MPSRPFLRISRSSRSGVALVIVLAFVLLLTGLVVAFFSRALSERQISNSSANQVKVDVLARGAVSTVIGDLQQEIAAGSTPFPLPAPTPTQGSATIFAPRVAATMVPAPVLPSPTPTSATGLENLVKQSVGGKSFYSNPTPAPATSSYDTSNFPPSKRAAKSTSGAGATGDNNTSKPSLSGRYISAARWNKPLLLPTDPTKPTNLTPMITGGTFVPPDWVLVTRDGLNGDPANPGNGPTAWNSNLITSTTKSTSVVGRYAYNVYDEGGLLDANVAGYPTTASSYPSTGTAPLPSPPTRKLSLAYADLTVPITLPSGSIQPLLTVAQVNALVGWRNYASAQSIGSFPTYMPASTPGSSPALSPFDIAALNITNGYLSVANGPLYNNGSDRMFGSRQQLIDFLLQGVAANDAERTGLQNSLNYLGTYSRGLNQPSFIRRQAVDSTNTLSYDNTVPKLLAANQGGNNAGPDNSGNPGLDEAINPSFLSVRVKTVVANMLRNDGSSFVVGEPLVKKRFSLNRLAWLTFAGPIASADGSKLNPTSDNGVAAIISSLENNYKYTDAFLKQGTATNIKKYFGLTWGNDPKSTAPGAMCWLYNVNNRGGSIGAIRKLSYAGDSGADVLGANREPDFFELLKATINVGSIAKVGTVMPTDPSYGNYLLPSEISQYNDDSRVDDAIIQMGANIIDQFDLDGYPTTINFNDGSITNGKDFYGIENLPYLSRLAHALVRVKQPDTTASSAGVIGDTGVGALLQCPVLWNPHDSNAANLDQTFGVVGPTQFRAYADSSNYPANNTIQLRALVRDQGGSANLGRDRRSADPNKSPGWQSRYFFNFSIEEPRTLKLDNTGLYFSVNRDVTPFREPTVLCETTTSNGYVDPAKLPARGSFGTIGGTDAFFASDGGFKSDVGSGMSGIPPVQGQGYVGFYLGALPLYWRDSSTSITVPLWVDQVAVVTPVNVDYHLQYQDSSGRWLDYDLKHRSMGGGGGRSESSSLSGGGDRSAASNGWKSFFYPEATSNITNYNHSDSSFAAMDPRTPRFGLMKLTAGKQDAPYWTYPPYGAGSATTATRMASASRVGFNNGWVNPGKGIILGLRSGTSDGTPFMCPLGVFPTSMGWNPGSAGAAGNGRFVASDNSTTPPVLGATSGAHVCRPGMFSQNNPFARRDNQVMGDDGDSSATDGAFAPPGVSDAAQFYTDPDGVVRRATGGLVPFTSSTNGAGVPPATTDVGLPMTAANTNGVTRLPQSNSRPVILNRPFRTVGELGYTFSGTPWKNLNFDMPESGDGALLDVFCVNDTDDANGLVAGKVNLNTRQAPVLQAILAGAYKDEWNPGTGTVSSTLAATIASHLVSRTTSTDPKKGPLQNVSELVGKWNADAGTTGMSGSLSTPIINPKSYVGFSADLLDNTVPLATGLDPDTNATIPRYQDATLRALAASGQTRVWNLLIDVIAQTGRYPQSATSFDKFSVEGEQRFWVHVAVDRLTGQVIDKQIEVVKE